MTKKIQSVFSCPQGGSADLEEAILQIRGPRPTHTATAREILGAAIALVEEVGAENFSARKVADRSGLKLASVQYYFPTRAALVRAMIEQWIDDYHDRLLALLADQSEDPAAAMTGYLDFLMTESLALRGRAFWNYVWSLADLDAEVSAALDQFMALYRSLFAMLIRRLNPALSELQSVRLAAALSSMIDGMGTVIGEGRYVASDLIGLDAMVKSLAYRIMCEKPV
ncbi:MAG: TetR/AcrR family transcriptional regulator [Sphingorhabdus sp.]|uniref:TetR/AcrR family transcriptional regulator n=1 Tax=Sphingorhabdus sp. TaxID=1902408 RepID=UPI0025F3BE11|nr:TetR family transcriptional regulator [Sphingorhabdus sp.]MCO4092240.1 TetR/AcrR family transcriptional regulator [Sphingorhabdus sp.]